MEIIDVHTGDSRHHDLSHQAFGTIFTNYWPHYVGLESIDEWLSSIAERRRALADGIRSDESVPVLSLAADRNRPLGFSYGIFFPDSNTMMGVFSAVAPEMQRRGLGRKIFDARLEQGQTLTRAYGNDRLRAFFIETMNPARAVDEQGQPCNREGMNPHDRKTVFHRLDCKDVIGLDYVQPFTYLIPGEEHNPADHDTETGAFSSYDLMFKRIEREPLIPVIGDFGRSLARSMRPPDPSDAASPGEQARTLQLQALSDMALGKFNVRLAEIAEAQYKQKARLGYWTDRDTPPAGSGVAR